MNGQVVLGDGPLTVDDVVAVARAYAPVSVGEGALEDLAASRRTVEAVAAADEAVYGINTGFGKLASIKIPADQLRQVQRNLILSHASGMGDPLPVDVVRAIILLRVNALLKPTSGVRPLLPRTLAAMLNAGIHPVVPELGSVGASGDLAPLAHVGLGVMGEGMVDVQPDKDGPPSRVSAAEALSRAGIGPVEFDVKEGLAFINGTQAQAAILALVVHDTHNLWRTAHGAAAMSLEALLGSPTPFDQRVQEVRPHTGQRESAALLRELLAGSEIRESHRVGDIRVQDAYSVRCAPQILGAVKDTLTYAQRVASIEIDAVTDNPLVLDGQLVSGGNFHGQPVAMALDFLTIAIATLANVAERRIERLVNPDLSQGLPAFLATCPGLESGFMTVQIGAAAVAAECRLLATPASVQSIPTNANQEDYVPMGMAAALKARRALANAQRVVACELLCAAQGVECRRPLTSGKGVEALLARIRSVAAPLVHDRSLTADIEAVAALVAQEALI